MRNVLIAAIDYAGLFPPAALDLHRTVENYARYREGPHQWALGRLVVPAARLPDLHACLEGMPNHDVAEPWRISALLGTDGAVGLMQVAEFTAAQSRYPRAVVDAVEAKVATGDEIRTLAHVAPPGVLVACEVSWPAIDTTLIDACRACGAAAKLRTGGIATTAVPGTQVVAKFLWRAARRGVPVKATAGLHHAMRGEYRLTYEPGAAVATLHGFLNVILAAAWAWEHAQDGGSDEEVPAPLLAVLEYRQDRSFSVADDGTLAWGELVLARRAIDSARAEFLLSFGSCSFEEPLDELKRLGLLS